MQRVSNCTSQTFPHGATDFLVAQWVQEAFINLKNSLRDCGCVKIIGEKITPIPMGNYTIVLVHVTGLVPDEDDDPDHDDPDEGPVQPPAKRNRRRSPRDCNPSRN